jgi:outer membrane receptor for monomeric catechols
MAIALAEPSVCNGQAAPQSPLPATASQAPNEEIVKLPRFNVNAALVDPYDQAEAASAARTASKLLDTPMTAYVLTPALIEDLAPNALFDVTQFFPGVSAGRATGAGSTNDRQTFRGFESFSITVDNMSNAMVPYMYGPYSNFYALFMDHAELIMGPDTILNPTGTPGGTVCVITKSPQFTQGTDVSGEVGNFNANKVTVDSTGPLGDGKHMAYRIMAGYQDSGSMPVPGAIIIWAGAAEFTYKFSDTAKLVVKYFGTQQRAGPNALAGATGEEVYTPDTVMGAMLSNTIQPGFRYNGTNGISSSTKIENRENAAEAELTAALSERINMRLAARVYYAYLDDDAAYPSPPLTETWDPTTGQETSVVPINPTALPEQYRSFQLESRDIQAQNDYAGNFNVGAVSLQPVAGWAYNQGSIPVYYQAQTKNMPPCNLAVGYYSPGNPPYSALTIDELNTPESGWTMQVYAYLRASFLNDRLFVSGGAARVWAGVTEYSLPYIEQDGINAGNPNGKVVEKTFSNTTNISMPSVQPWHDTYVAGILGKVLPNVSVYYNFSTNSGLAASAPMWQAGVQNEFGIKANFFNNRITVTADHFEIKQNNISYSNPLFTAGQSPIPNIYEDLACHGEEFNITGGITKNLSIIASYTNQKLRDVYGRRQRNIPDYMEQGVLDYHFDKGALKNLDCFVGVIHEGDVAGETIAGFTALGVPEQPGFYVQPHSVYNAGAGYRWRNYRFNLCVDNVFNQHFWWEAQARSSLSAYPGTNITLTVTVHI